MLRKVLAVAVHEIITCLILIVVHQRSCLFVFKKKKKGKAYFYLFGVLGIELRISGLLSKCSTT